MILQNLEQALDSANFIFFITLFSVGAYLFKKLKPVYINIIRLNKEYEKYIETQKKAEKNIEEIKRLKQILKMMLEDRLYRKLEEIKQLNKLTKYDKIELDTLYPLYTELGGNGTVKLMFNEVLELAKKNNWL